MKRVIIEAPYIDQSLRWPTGCESVSAVMLLRYLGYDITVDEFIENDLEIQDFREENGEIFGPDPRKYFCGSPYDPDAFGCYAPVIVNALSKVFAGEKKYEAADETGISEKELLEKYIDRGMPVIFWACIDMREPVTGRSGGFAIRENGSHGYRMSTVCCWSGMMMKNIILTIRTMGTA